LVQWDALAFLHRHGASLASAEQISRLLGYRSDALCKALDSLTASGLVVRSRNSRGLRLYRLAGSVAALDELIGMVNDREGRLLLIEQFGQRARGMERRVQALHLA
jgi:DNA-binding MarR family transcriptional regulator